jgi:hypothetical protein
MVWFADASTNPWGIHAFGVWDWHEAADPKYWYYYRQGDEKYPTTTGLSGMYISEILIYSQEEPAGSIEITSIPAGADIYLDGEETGKVTPFTMANIPAGSHTISVRKDGYIASDEEWIEVLHGMIIPVHFNLEREYSPTISGSGDTSLTSKTSNNGEQAALEKLEDVIRGKHIDLQSFRRTPSVHEWPDTFIFHQNRSSSSPLGEALYLFRGRVYK